MELFGREFFGTQLAYQRVSPENIGATKLLHQMIFPLPYRDAYFSDLLKAASFSFVGTGSPSPSCLYGSAPGSESDRLLLL